MFLGVMGATTARADNDDYARRDGHHIYMDIKDVRRDEARLRDLERQRDRERREHDWGQVRLLDRRIADLRWHIDHDRREIHRDIDHYHHDRD
jgi:hypothetical protein